MEATLTHNESYAVSNVEESISTPQQRKIVTLIRPTTNHTPAWDPYEVWQRMIKEPRDRKLASRED